MNPNSNRNKNFIFFIMQQFLKVRDKLELKFSNFDHATSALAYANVCQTHANVCVIFSLLTCKGLNCAHG